ncbi:MAG: UDP-N-acetylglucosamine 2-epimerase, partial [Cyanobacteria bacterium REEB65]|nr:UDP-N-acetylglucosamine 2-epimerase [Cyanobacteria bacterium REEB65]
MADRKALAKHLGLDPSARWVLFTFHPETLVSLGVNVVRVRTCLDFLSKPRGLQVVLLDPNADLASRHITTELQKAEKRDPSRFRLLHNLEPDVYTNFMRHAYLMIGNSSAGLLEAPSARLAVIDVGDRQKGRLRAANVVHASGDARSLRVAWRRISNSRFRRRLTGLANPFGDGRTGARIASILARVDPRTLPLKSFHGDPR